MKKKITKVPKFKDFKTTRATSAALEKILYKQIPILDLLTIWELISL